MTSSLSVVSVRFSCMRMKGAQKCIKTASRQALPVRGSMSSPELVPTWCQVLASYTQTEPAGALSGTAPQCLPESLLSSGVGCLPDR